MSINDKELLELEEGLVIDCREADEFAQGHLPNAINAPLMGLIMNPEQFLTKGKDVTYYVHCLSGGRAGNACAQLSSKGYKVENVGGVMSYSGELVN